MMSFNCRKCWGWITVSSLFLVSCTWVDHSPVDYRTEKVAWGDCQFGEQFVLLEDVFLLNVDREIKHFERLALSPAMSSEANNIGRMHLTPYSVQQYRESPSNVVRRSVGGEVRTDAIDVRGIVDAGTMLECDEVRKFDVIAGTLAKGTTYRRFAKILEGEFAGVVADMADLTDYCCEIDGYDVMNLDRRIARKL